MCHNVQHINKLGEELSFAIQVKPEGLVLHLAKDVDVCHPDEQDDGPGQLGVQQV